MLVSVIIPCYNVEEYVEESINSVLHQTHHDLEVILVDDGSTDRTVSILRSFAGSQPGRIIFIKNNENRGAPHARNCGLAAARGEYIQFLDADDLLLPEKIKHQSGMIESSGTKPDFVAGNEYWQKIDGTRIEFHKFTRNPWKDLISGTLGDTCSNLWRAESLRKIDGWNEHMKSSQEADLLFRMMKTNPAILYDDAPLTVIRQRKAGSISKANEKENILRQVYLRTEMGKYMETNGLMSDEIREVYLKIIFIAIRSLFRLDEKEAMSLLREHVPDSFPSSPGSQQVWMYRLLYMFLGFRRTEKVFSFLPLSM